MWKALGFGKILSNFLKSLLLVNLQAPPLANELYPSRPIFTLKQALCQILTVAFHRLYLILL